MTVDVLIPVYKPDRRFARLLQMLKKQTVVPDRIIIMNTEKAYWNADGYRDIPGMEVHHLTKEEFDHGGTRNLAAVSMLRLLPMPSHLPLYSQETVPNRLH